MYLLIQVNQILTKNIEGGNHSGELIIDLKIHWLFLDQYDGALHLESTDNNMAINIFGTLHLKVYP